MSKLQFVHKVFIFDVDGTLTPSRQPMTKEFQEFFKEWVEKNKFYLVTGSDIEKLQEQMCFYDIEAEALFTCCGNEMWIPDPHIVNISAYPVYQNKFIPPNQLLTYLGEQIRFSETPVQATKHREDRGSMLNFSVVGRDCTMEERATYFSWDNQVEERKTIAEFIRKQWPELDAVIGGQISIDIYPKGKDKSQIFEHIEKIENFFCPDEYIFIGDRTTKGGNDYSLAKLMEETDNCSYYQVDGWKETKSILEVLND